MPDPLETHYDAIVIGSGFGGSVAALRLVEKGYRVLVLEKGRRFGRGDFAKTNWNLRRWMWLPGAGLRGIYAMTFFRHVTVLSGVGVGGGSLTYACTLPVPKTPFFEAPSWRHLGDWERELSPHYATARKMLGAAPNPARTPSDAVLAEIAQEAGRAEHFHPNEVGIFFGEPGKPAPDPYFGGQGPERTGCTLCGACMTGCRVGAKNTLDLNYLYLAEKVGATVLAETLATEIIPRPEGGYSVTAKLSRGLFRPARRFTADRVFMAGGVLGTVDLLLAMRDTHLPRLSLRLGYGVRTNSESLIGIVAPRHPADFTQGTAITSIYHTDERSHVEPVRYGQGSGFFRLLIAPHAPGGSFFGRILAGLRNFFRQPLQWLRVFLLSDFSKKSQVLLYMRTEEGTLRFARKRSPWALFRRVMRTEISDGAPPRASIPEATALAERFAAKVGGVTGSLVTEFALNAPTTAHILGGACMGKTVDEGVIDADHQVFNYPGLYVVDGAAVSANPGVNPSLTITALAERALAKIPAAALKP